jgi:tungstate transport system substrate-binding protein
MIDRLRGKAIWRFGVVFLAFALVFSLAGCAAEEEPVAEEPVAEDVAAEPVETTDLILASTTSTQDSGLFDVLIPAFEEAHPEYKVNVIAVGTGEALELGQNKDADVLLVHAKAKEETFVADGYGTARQDVMYNDFIIVGPGAHPAGIKGDTVAEALKKISDAGTTFISRGDESGTHTAEKALWEKSAITPAGAWYNSAGKGMGDVLTMASEMAGYTLTDRATYLNMKNDLQLEILCEGDTVLFNQYGVIPVTDATNMDGAQAFADWIVSDEAQAVIAEYGVEKFGAPLFFPNAQ